MLSCKFNLIPHDSFVKREALSRMVLAPVGLHRAARTGLHHRRGSHADTFATQIYTQVMNRPGLGLRSPLDAHGRRNKAIAILWRSRILGL